MPWYDVPDWRGRKRYWEPINWADNLAVGVYRWKTKQGHEKRWYLLKRIGDEILYWPVLASTTLTTGAGTQQTLTSDATWNNANNTVESLGAGGSGAAGIGTGGPYQCAGGGAGLYAKITNFSFATPGTTTAGYLLGTGGAAFTANSTTTNHAGNNGGNTWFNATSFATGSTNAQCNAAGGSGGQVGNGTTQTGPAGTTGWGQTLNAGGAGGTCGGTAAKVQGSGGGGAGGPNGAGNAGATISTGLTNAGSTGGQGDATSGGTGGASGVAGNPGTEWGSTGIGSGGGSGGSGAGNASVTVPAGGNYGAGGGGASSGKTSGGPTAVSGAGTQGLIVLTWTPVGAPLIGDWLHFFPA